MGNLFKIKSFEFSLLFILVSLIFIPSYSEAIGLGISPGVLSYKNVLKGGYSQQSLVVSSFMPQNLTVNFEMGGDIKDWIVIDENITNMTLSTNTPRQLKVKIFPPIDTANGEYTGSIRIITDKIVDPETGIGSSIKAAFLVRINVLVTGDQIVACSGGGLGISDVEINYPLVISTSVTNEGNVRMSPVVFVDIWDKYQKEIVYSGSVNLDSILPTEVSTSTKELLADLPEDQYWAEIKVPDCQVSSTITFNVVEKGGISDKGELVRVENKPWALSDEIIPITAFFRNDGGRTVSAKFKGEILYNGKVVKVIDTDSLDAAPGEIVSLQSFFKPSDAGQYFVMGKVYFNNKLTGEKGSVINVNKGQTVSSNNSINYFWYILMFIILVIIILLILIKKKKQKHKSRK